MATVCSCTTQSQQASHKEEIRRLYNGRWTCLGSELFHMTLHTILSSDDTGRFWEKGRRPSALDVALDIFQGEYAGRIWQDHLHFPQLQEPHGEHHSPILFLQQETAEESAPRHLVADLAFEDSWEEELCQPPTAPETAETVVASAYSFNEVTTQNQGLIRTTNVTDVPTSTVQQFQSDLKENAGSKSALQSHGGDAGDDDSDEWMYDLLDADPYVSISLEEYCLQNMSIEPRDLKPTALVRIQDLAQLFRVMASKGIIRLTDAQPGHVNSIFGFENIFVHDIGNFNEHITAMVREDRQHCWHANGRRNLLQPTSPCYEILRQLGIHPVKGTRGTTRTDFPPSGRDFMLYSQYTFTLSRMQKNCHRLKIGVIGNRRS